MPLYSGGETPPRFAFRVPLKPFGRSLIHCYTLKPADIRAFLRMGGGGAFDFTPPTPALRGGYVRITKQTSRCDPTPRTPYVFHPPAKKIV